MNNKDAYKIKTSYANYFAEVQHFYNEIDENYMDKIVIGSKRKCMFISVYLDGDAPNIDAVGYTHQQHHGTIHMIKCGIAFVKQKYQKYLEAHRIDTLQLIDKSSIQCERKYEQSLPNFYIAKYGKTWYEKHFNAIPEDIDISKYADDKAKLKQALKTKPDLKFKVKGLDEVYAKYNDIGTFIKEATSQYDCRVLKGWFDAFLKRYLPYLDPWRFKMPFLFLSCLCIEIEMKHKHEDYKLSAVRYHLTSNGSFAETCRIFQCSERSLKRWIDRYNLEGNIERHNRPSLSYKVKLKHVNTAVKILSENQQITMEALAQRLRKEHNDFTITRKHLGDVVRDVNITLCLG